jgi:hypothetical protein
MNAPIRVTRPTDLFGQGLLAIMESRRLRAWSHELKRQARKVGRQRPRELLDHICHARNTEDAVRRRHIKALVRAFQRRRQHVTPGAAQA